MSRLNIQRFFSSKLVWALLFLAVGLEIAALLVYWRLDSLVNSDLYDYGLQFNIKWASEYSSNYRASIGSLLGVITLTVLTLVPFHLYGDESGLFVRASCILFPAIAASLAAGALFFVLRVDYVVNGTMYQYGLQFSSTWAEAYWTIARTTLVLAGAAVVVLLFMALVVWVMTRE